MIDDEGFRANVGIILCRGGNELFWAKRVGQQAWQFPQGGIRRGESPREAVYRELEEEVGLTARDTRVVATTRNWLRYRLPKHLVRHNSRPLCIGQKQKWFMLELLAPETRVRFDRTSSPEFDGYRWVDYWHPLAEVVSFKRQVYRQALKELAAHIARTSTVD
ncbi:RNA pyrophosphohydrolase [Salinisphaera sp. USBA-960]|uniref:RNA pyrophosphohydrolase n=1 Tax=Salinisphaera orenii TaxID=856731 RepID=UPI000DBE6EB7|nr:RNA pyrophosphohydrolase [Salifodinibacter halophilus]NNC25372.1 RNA pyrophosphohydrolase [Salifodinibacter halophilus]